MAQWSNFHGALPQRVPIALIDPTQNLMQIMKTREETIDCLIRATRSRAIRESIAALFIMFWFARDLHSSALYSPAYFGAMIVIAASGFIMGMLWCYTLTHDLIQFHPSSDSAFWQTAFESQAKLLSSVPVWYIAPLFIGITLQAVPTTPGRFVWFVTYELFLVTICVFVVWLNRTAASQLRAEARTQFAELPA